MKIHFLLDCFISKDKVMIRNERVQCFLLVQNSSKQQYSFHIFVWFIYYLKQIFKRTEIFNSYRHCVKSVRIRSFSGSYFAAFGLNTERYTVFSPNYQTNSEYRHFSCSERLPFKRTTAQKMKFTIMNFSIQWEQIITGYFLGIMSNTQNNCWNKAS